MILDLGLMASTPTSIPFHGSVLSRGLRGSKNLELRLMVKILHYF